MKRWIWILVGVIGLQTSATASTPHVQLVCRDDDPFLFCTKGCLPPDYAWKPLNPIQGTWLPISPPYCTGPYVVSNYCIPWTQKAIQALAQYESICPGAFKQGKWTGTKPPELVPEPH
ncbi:hypothetical protein [Xanthomonas graminis]|uniref:hypothetical protein n=1 Tax=Xanthomonas graminis TaxID=3390026 RepID=UPI0009BDB053|nr:hypothetical protein [Xanthomonas translucens]WIH05304.1 hypothetical protein KHF85_01935 [Xanthomonas translucens pv. graminis]